MKTVDKMDRRPEAEDARAAKVRKSAKLSDALGRLAPKKSSEGLPVVIWTMFFRSIVLIADYLLASTTATVLIPMLGAWLHQRSGLAGGQLSMAGTIAMWIAPFTFLVLLLAAGEIATMRAMWAWATHRIQSIRDARGGAAATHTPSAPKSRMNPQPKKADRNRSK